MLLRVAVDVIISLSLSLSLSLSREKSSCVVCGARAKENKNEGNAFFVSGG